VAFCWYNLSSIVNSLVYFDQFSLLSTKSLLLVILGIVILLGGVWVVSVPASGDGGEGVEIGSWRDEESDLPGHGDIFLSHDAPITEDPQDDSEIGLRRVSVEVLSPPHDTSTFPVSPPSSPPLTSPPARHSRYKPSNLTTHGPSFSSGALSSNRRQSANLLSPPLNASALGGGFAIGISVASPGFSVLPRRRVASGSSGFSDGAGTEPGAMRRAASEGDAALRWEPLSLPPPHNANSSGHQDVGSTSHGGAQPGVKKGRWNWLRGLVRR
jgi:hypothetical protein